MKYYDSIIVGGGAVGASAALLLSRVGLKVLLIESLASFNAETNFNSPTIALSHASSQILKKANVWDSEKLLPVAINQVKVSIKGKFGSSRLVSPNPSTALGYVVATANLVNNIYQELNSFANCEVIFSAKIIDYQQNGNGWELVVDHNDKHNVYNAALLIAADGLNSKIRQKVGINCQHFEYGHFALVANIELNKTLNNIAVERFLSDGAIALLPWKDKMATCVWTINLTDYQRIKDQNPNQLTYLIQQQLGTAYGLVKKLGKCKFLPLKMQLANNQIASKLLLLGNAAHFLHPIAAQGLNLSLKDVWSFTQLLVENGLEQISSNQLLRSYDTNRTFEQKRISFATNNIAKFMASASLPAWCRAMGLTLFDSFTPLRNGFTKVGMGTM